MLQTFNSIEICRLSLVIGAFVAIKYKDRYGVIPGGIIVPGFIITLLLISPLWCATIIGLSFPVYWLYKKFLDRTDYKRRTPMYILAFLSIAIANLIALMYLHLGWLTPSLDSLSGTMIPAVIAFTFTKQKISRVVRGMVISTLITILLVSCLYVVGTTLLNLDFDFLSSIYVGKETIEIKHSLVQFYIALGIGYFFYHYQDIRSGGYLIAPVAAALLAQPISAIAFFGGCILIYLLTQKICQITLLVGLKRYTMVLLLCTIYIWFLELICVFLDSSILPFQGSNIFVIIAMLSYVNDGILYGEQNIIKFMYYTVLISFVTLMTIRLFALIFI